MACLSLRLALSWRHVSCLELDSPLFSPLAIPTAATEPSGMEFHRVNELDPSAATRRLGERALPPQRQKQLNIHMTSQYRSPVPFCYWHMRGLEKERWGPTWLRFQSQHQA